MQYIRLQLGALVILLYVGFIYLKECRRFDRKMSEEMFSRLWLAGIFSVIFDGATAYTVNMPDTVPPIVNRILHNLYFIGLDLVILVLFVYILNITGTYPRNKLMRAAVYLPFAANLAVMEIFADSLEYRVGKITNYTIGIPAYGCYLMAAVYIILTVVFFIRRWNCIEQQKRVGIFTYLMVLVVVTAVQMIFPETLITSIGTTVVVLGMYLNLEDPAIRELSIFHNEMVMGFANLVENRDNNTGGHIKRTSRYVELIAEELQRKNCFPDILTKDYITNLIKAAPLHDVGKISVPDQILQKPGKLTDEEFAIMKLHAENGGNIIRETFRNLRDEDYRRMAFEVARYHHEKWNGKGYPDGISGNDIPLCARIMAVADVFDAVSEKRCYRDAMPIDKCFKIIEDGAGIDFDPYIAEIFLSIRDKVEAVHNEFAFQSAHTATGETLHSHRDG